MKNLFPIPIIIFLLIYNSLYSNNISIQKSDIQAGLSSNYIRSIYKDCQGLMWFGTDNGLDSYDGYQFVSYGKRLKTPLKGIVQSVIETGKEKYIIGTTWGAYIYSKNRNLINLIDFGTQAPDVRQVYRTSGGKVYLITDKNLFSLDENSCKAYPFSTYAFKNPLIGLLEDSRHNLWVVSQNIIYRIDSKKVVKSVEPGCKIQSVTLLGTEELFLGTENGLYCFNLKTAQTTSVNDLKNYNIKTLATDKVANLFIGTYYDGLLIYNIRNGRIKRITSDGVPSQSVSVDNISSLFYDQSNTLWVGTFSGGLNKIKLQSGSPFLTPGMAEIKKAQIRSLFITPEGEKYIGSNIGLIHLDSKDQLAAQFQNFSASALRSKVLTTIYPFPDKPDILLIGTFGGGISLFNRKTGAFSAFSSKPTFTSGSVYRFYNDNDQHLWMATLDGLFKYNLSGKSLIQYNLNTLIGNNEIFYVTGDYKGRIWIGTKTGACYFSPVDHKFHYPRLLARYRFQCTSIFCDEKGNVWFTFNKGGVLKTDQNLKKQMWLSSEIGLPENSPASIINDKQGNAWISTLKGLYRVNSKQQVRYFGLEDGLSGTGFCPGVASLDSNHNLWWSNEKGLVMYSPKIEQKKRPYHILFSNLFINGNPNAIDTLSYVKKESDSNYQITIKGRHNNNLEFQVSALNFENPRNNTYSYVLTGNGYLQKTSSTKNIVSYNNLPAGNYTLTVVAADGDGFKAKQTLVIAFSIIPFFYESTWFLLAIIVIIGGIILFFTRKYIFRMKDKFMTQLEESKKKQNVGSGIQRVSGEKAVIIKEKLLSYMQDEKPYLNAELRQADVANAIECSVHEISEVINSQLNLNFADFINSYRIEEVKRKIESGEDRKFTMSAIAKQCGFNVNSSFIRAFKKATGVTPSQYFRSNSNENNPV